MTEPQKYDDLDYTPTHGEVRVENFAVKVPTHQGRAMEGEGIPVFWIYASIPDSVAQPGLSAAYVALHRLFTWPGRFMGRWS
jgi:hypothetical protein